MMGEKLKKLIVALLCWTLATVAGQPALAAVVVSFTQPSSPVLVGEHFTVSLVADIADPVLGFGLDVSFDPTVIRLASIVIADPPWTAFSDFDGDALAAITITPLEGSDIVLATLSFDAIGSGISGLSAGVTPGDLLEGFPLAPPASPGDYAEVTFVDSRVTVVPTPGSWVLTGLGLILLGGRWRNRRRGPGC